MEKISLNDSQWHLALYFGEECFLRNDYKNERLTGFIPARVYGIVQEDLLEQNLIEDLYFDTSSTKANGYSSGIGYISDFSTFMKLWYCLE